MDVLYPMAYFGPGERVTGELRAAVAEATAANPKVKLHAGLGGYIKEPADICAEGASAYGLGCDGISIFDAGSLRKKPGGIASYTGCFKSSQSAEREAASKTVVYDEPILAALAGAWPDSELPDGWESKAGEREREFREAVKNDLPPILAKMEREGVTLPKWLEARGIFRFVHPLDPPEKMLDQFKKAEEALAKISAGEDFAKVAGESSQWGTRSFGGALGRVFPAGDSFLPADAGELKAGETSGVLRGESGFWILKVDSAGGGEQIPYSSADYSSKREALREALGKLYKGREAASLPAGSEGSR
jgi:hypothetical protein